MSYYTSIKQLISGYINKALGIYAYGKCPQSIKSENIYLSKGRDVKEILYISNIALVLEKSEKFSVIEIANAIGSHISTIYNKEFKIKIVAPGWLHFEVLHPFLATWLQHLIRNGEALEVGEVGEELAPPTPPALFSAQYAHARCCSLLRLAEREGLTKGLDRIPWLDGDRLSLNQHKEARLIAELIEVVDRICCDLGFNWEKAALSLSQAFESFWSHCRIWGEVKTTSPELAQARLGLIMATQSVLKFLLEEKLGIFAVVEL